MESNFNSNSCWRANALWGHNFAMETFGERLRLRAKELGLSDSEVARRLGLSQARYSNYVNGNREPDNATLVRICRVLDTTPDAILGFSEVVLVSSEEDSLTQRITAAAHAMTVDTLRIAAAVMDALVANQPEVQSGEKAVEKRLKP